MAATTAASPRTNLRQGDVAITILMGLTRELLAEMLKDPRVPWIPWIGGKGAHSVLVSDLLAFLSGADLSTTEHELDLLVRALGGQKKERLGFIWPISAWRRWRRHPDSVPPIYEFPAEVQAPSYRQRLLAAKAGKAAR